MQAEASERAALVEGPGGSRWLQGWAGGRIVAGITSRRADLAALLRAAGAASRAVEAEQVHGASVAVVGRTAAPTVPIPGCDALMTDAAGLPLLVRTADCVPLFFADPQRGAIGIAHAGWRGLAAALPARMVAAFRHAYQSRAQALRVAIGPAIRSCCYDVGPEFDGRFGGFVRVREGRRTCDLVGAAVDQLRASGVPAARIADTRRCTACEPDTWFSLRREGAAAGRLVSLIMLREDRPSEDRACIA